MSINLKNKNVITRKERQCYSCYRKFPKGTKMNYWVCIYDGDFGADYTCMSCVEIMNRCQDEDGYPQGYVLEMLEKGQTPEQLIEQLDKQLK